MEDNGTPDGEFDIAVIGMSGKFPGADNVDSFWRNLCAGEESVRFFSDQELLDNGVPDAFVTNPAYVKAAPVLDNPELFDRAFFGYTPREALSMDPQHRLLLETAWHAVEDAGYNCHASGLRVGVYASCAMNTYLLNTDVLPRFGSDYLPTLIGSDKDFLATRISHRLGLTGPSISVQSACSSSLVAIHLACQSLLSDEIDMAVVGAAAIKVPHVWGHMAQTGSVFTTDGHCRPFDAQASGTIFGSGVAAVVLRRVSDAIDDGDNIAAVVKGTAVNNDGASKSEYTAPSVTSQSNVVAEAMEIAGVDPEQVTYIEAHGTGTFLGDPIELTALKKAYSDAAQTGYCAVGSLKANIGHLDAAAGITGFIKTVCCLRDGRIPGQINFNSPNPHLGLDNSPFFVNTETRDWFSHANASCAAITSLGIGGTNAHAILGKAPARLSPASPQTDYAVFPISARSTRSLQSTAVKLGEQLRTAPVSRDAVANTLQYGRVPFNHRAFVVASDLAEASQQFSKLSANEGQVNRIDGSLNEIVFMFSGQGSQYSGMAAGIYKQIPVFRETIDHCCELLQEHLSVDLRRLMFDIPAEDTASTATLTLNDTAVTQPALFCVEYALAKTLYAAGVVPAVMLGHSIGEYVAACLAGVFSLQDALALVAKRGALMQRLPAGSMLNVECPYSDISEWLDDSLDVACENVSGSVVISGADPEIDQLIKRLDERATKYARLNTSHAFHSSMMDPMLDEFRQCFSAVTLNAPAVPVVSNLTGQLMTRQQATSAAYWADHLRGTVQFSRCLAEVLTTPGRVLLEVGPGRVLTSLANRHASRSSQPVINTTRHVAESLPDEKVFLSALGKLWQCGFTVDWTALGGGKGRVSLPGYAFEPEAFWANALEPQAREEGPALAGNESRFSTAGWVQAPLAQVDLPSPAQASCLLFFADQESQGCELSQQLLSALTERDYAITRVQHAEQFSQLSQDSYTACLHDAADIESLFNTLSLTQSNIETVMFICLAGDSSSKLNAPVDSIINPMLSLVTVANGVQVAAQGNKTSLAVLTTGAVDFQVDTIKTAAQMLRAPALTISQEYASLRAGLVDVPEVLANSRNFVTNSSLLKDLLDPVASSITAYRNYLRWQPTLEKTSHACTAVLPGQRSTSTIRKQGRYLITGGLGRIGLSIARHLAEHYQATTVLASRSGFPPREEWATIVAANQDQTLVNRINAINNIEQLGGTVVVKSLDVTSLQQFSDVVSECEVQVGAFQGVIHAAGLVGTQDFQFLKNTNRENAWRQLSPKIAGINNLASVFAGSQLDFILLTSSLAAILGGLRHTSYAAGNIYLDAVVAEQWNQGNTHWYSIAWDAWQSSRDGGLSESFALDSLEYLLNAAGVSRLVVTAGTTQAEASIESVAALPGEQSIIKPESRNASNDSISREGLRSVVREIWSDETGITELADDADYFAIGGTSLMAIQIASRIQSALSVETDMAMIFEYPSIELLCQQLAQSLGGAAVDSAVETTSNKAVNASNYELSVDQTPLWFLDMLRQGSESDHIAYAFTLTGKLDIDRLEAALSKVVERQSVLRTVFTSDGETIVQEVKPEMPVRIDQIATDSVQEAIKAAVLEKFNLASGPLFRLRLLNKPEGQSNHQAVLLVVLHHIIADGQSFAVLFSELSAFYAEEDGTDAALPVPGASYFDYVNWRNQQASQCAYQDYLQTAEGYPEGADPESLRQLVAEIPPDKVRPATQSVAGARLPFAFNETELAEMTSVSTAHGISVYALLLSAHYLLLSEAAGKQTVCVGVPVSLRDKPEFNACMGMCVNMNAVYLSLPLETSLQALLQYVKNTLLQSLKNRFLPFTDVVSHINPDRDMSRNPLFQTMIQYSTRPQLTLAGIQVEHCEFDPGISQFDLTLHHFEDDGGISGFVEYDTDLYTAETIIQLVSRYRQIIDAFKNDTSVSIKSVVDVADRDRIGKKPAA